VTETTHPERGPQLAIIRHAQETSDNVALTCRRQLAVTSRAPGIEGRRANASGCGDELSTYMSIA
jgi:hypothetical protein